MSPVQFALVLAAQVAQVGGQLLLKRGMTRSAGRLPPVLAGMALLAFWFLAWLTLLQEIDISYLYPFEGISMVLLVLAARMILHERTPRWAWFGVAMITLGMTLVGLDHN